MSSVDLHHCLSPHLGAFGALPQTATAGPSMATSQAETLLLPQQAAAVAPPTRGPQQQVGVLPSRMMSLHHVREVRILSGKVMRK